MYQSERSRPQFKAKHPRLKRLLSKRRSDVPPKGQWFTTADTEGNVSIHPNR